MKSLTITSRIVLMIVVAILSLFIVGVVGLYVSAEQTKSIRYIEENSLESINTLNEARQSYMMLRLLGVNHISSRDLDAKKAVEAKMQSLSDGVKESLTSYEKLISDEEDRTLLKADRERFDTYWEFMTKEVLPLSRKNEPDTDENKKKVAQINTHAFQALDSHIAFNQRSANESAKAAITSAEKGKLISEWVLVSGILTVGLLGFFVAKDIRSRMHLLRRCITEVNQSLDFTQRIPVTHMDELGSSADAFNKLIERLQGSFKTIASGALSVASGAKAMATTSDQVAKASNEQSEAASNMAATVEEMTVSINHVADRAHEANRISNESGQLAITGESIISQTTSDIQDIAITVRDAAILIEGLERHSQEIAKVVSVIKDVANQTNLLALNAAIEAARAGEQGRGFAVVADEVRKLAERTAISTKEIADTIDTMRGTASSAVNSMQGVVDKVEAGVERSQKADESIKQIGEGSRKAVGMVDEITSAIREQGAATDNIATQVERIAQMSEESNEAAMHSAETAHNLDLLATEMQQIVSIYRL